ncbi:MAG: hypothetical protein LBT05_03305 [Planctomycetaceae bacterium]|jgi:hypothetical protein|nr:hypothetical protein [Planctomycetaceae bacterium]
MSMKKSFYSYLIQSLFKTETNNRDAGNPRKLGLELLEKRELLSVNTRQLLVDDFSDFTQEDSVVADNQTSTSSEESQSVSLSELENDDIYGAFLESNLDVNLLESEWHNISSQSSQAEEDDCGFGTYEGGSIEAETPSLELIEGEVNYAVIAISRSDAADLDSTMDVTVHFQVAREITYLNGTTETSTLTTSFVIPAGDDAYDYQIPINDDYAPEISEIITFTLLSAEHDNAEYEISSSEIVINVIDNDNWTFSSEVTG